MKKETFTISDELLKRLMYDSAELLDRRREVKESYMDKCAVDQVRDELFLETIELSFNNLLKEIIVN